jgi:gliding motility-associated-like protein
MSKRFLQLFQFSIRVLLFSFITAREAKASHGVGADLTYRCDGGNTYTFFFTLYRDCSGIAVSSFYQIDGTSSCGNTTITVNLDSTVELWRFGNCPGVVSKCADFNSPYMGIESNYYHGTVTLPAACSDWTFGIPPICNRNAAITNIVSPGGTCLYVQAKLNNAIAPCNSSPTFSNRPYVFLCDSNIQYYNHGAYDADGDSLVFTMYTPHSNPTLDVVYIAGLSATQPVTYNFPDSTTLNRATGDIRIVANAPQITVLAIRVDEYRNGVLIGSVERDIQIIVESCTDKPPSLSGVNGTPSFTYTACANAPMTFLIKSFDLDVNDTTRITWDNGIGNGSMITTNSRRDTAFFSWTPNDADTLTNPHVFTATVTDNFCPVPRSNVYTYTVNVRGVIANAGLDQTVACGDSTDLHAIGLGGTGGPYSYLWLPNTNSQDLLGVGVGTYQVVVTTQVSPTLSCRDTDEVLVNPGIGVPAVNFTTAINGVCTRTYNFTDHTNVNGGLIQSWTWNFDDPASGANNTSSLQNPSHTFTTPGTYDVTLDVNAGAGCDGQYIMQIVIDPYPVANFAAPSVCEGTPTSLNSGSTSGTITNWNWNFNNGGGSTSSAQNPQWTFTADGSYNVYLSVTDNNGCVDDTTISVTVWASPVADAGLDASVCNGSSATLTATGGASYSWSSGQTTASITVSPVATTNYTVTVTSVNGCTDTDVATVSVNTMPVANAGLDQTICQGGSATLTATGAGGGGTYTWSNGATTATITVNPGSTQIYTVTAATGPGCTSTDQVQVIVNTSPVANAGTDQAVCNGSSATLTASGGAGYLWIGTGQTTASLTVTPPVTTTYQVQVSNAGGCKDTDDVIVTVNPIPVAVFVNSGPVCQGGSITFTDQSNITTGSITQWNWTLGGSTGNSTSQNPSSTYNTPGNSTVVLHVTSNAGCIDSVTQNITVHANPVANAGNDVEICVGGNTSLTASGAGGGGGYLWSPGGMTTANILVNPLVTQVYTVTVTDINGCVDNDDASVIVHLLPEAAAGPDVGICKGYSTDLNGTGGDTYIWNPGNIATATISVNPSTTTTYYLQVTSQYGCVNYDTTVVTVNPLPQATFANSAPVCQGNAVNFIDNSAVTSGSINSWNWNFGNAGTSTSQNPSSVYNTSGPFTVQLIVSTDAGCIDTTTQNINIWALPPASAGVDDEICDGETASLTASGGSQYLWNPGGMITAVIAIDPDITTTYTVTVTDANGCSAMDAAAVIVNPLPVPILSADQSICLGDNTTLTCSGGATYDWTPGNLSGSTISISPSSTTTYTVLVTTGAGCQATDQVTVSVNPIPVASFQNSGNVCQYNSISFNDQSNVSSGSITNWNWNFGDGGSSTSANPSNFYSAFGNFNVVLTVTTDNGCIDQEIVPVVVYEKPNALISAPDVCDGNPVVFNNASSISDASTLYYAWDLGDASTTTDANPVHSYTVWGHYNVTMIVASGHSCLDTMQLLANVNPLPVAAISVESVCEGIPAEFNDGSMVAEGQVSGWNWNFGDGVASSDQNVAHPFAEYGNYIITLDVVTNHGCPDHTDYNLRIRPNPEPDFTSINDCVGKPTPFSDYSTIPTGSITSWHWEFGDGTTEDNQNPVHYYPYSGFYDVTLTETSDSGCVYTYKRDDAVNVYAGPSADFSSNAELADDNYPFVQFYNQTPTTGQFYWSFGDGDTSNYFAPNHLYDSVGVYEVQLITIDNNGCVDTTLKKIEIKPTSTFYVPNSFTPNKDGVNDEFRPFFTNLTDIDVQIFDRWGAKIFEYKNLDGSWDGRYKGDMAQSDVYVYKIKTTDVRQIQSSYVGHVTLVR